MFDYLVLFFATFTAASLSLFNSFFKRKNIGKFGITEIYNLIMVSAVTVAWAGVWAFEGGFSVKVIPYSLIFGVGYSFAVIGLMNALACGPVALSTLIMQLSLIGTAVWGFFFWDSPIKITVILGLILVVIALFCCIFTPKSHSDKRVSPKWIFWITVCFLGNAAASITSRTQQLNFDGKLKGQLITCGVVITLAVCLVLYLKSDRRDSFVIAKESGFIPAIAGLLNVLHNFIVLFLATSIVPASLQYPTTSIGGIAIVSLFAHFVFKEKLTKLQWTGLFLGVAATALLSI